MSFSVLTTEKILTANTAPDPKFQMRRLKNAKVTVLGHRLDVIKMAPRQRSGESRVHNLN